MLELRHLRTLCAIADTGSLGKAAVMLGYSQPAISTQLRRLEGMLGGQLFVRSSTGVELTAFGLEVVDQARDILARASALGRGTAVPAEGGSALRIGATITPVLAGLVARIRATWPEVSVAVRSEYSTRALLDSLEADAIDLAIVLEYPGRELKHSESLAHRAFAIEPAFVALPAGHRLAQQTEIPLAELSHEAWFVTPDDGAGWPEVFYQACERAGFQPAKTHEFLDERNLQHLIAAGVGVSACQPTMKPIYGVAIRPLVGTPIRYHQVLVWRKNGPAAAFSSSLCLQAAEVYRELITQSSQFHAWTLRHSRA